MLDESNTLNMMETPDAPPPEEKSNRTFWIVGGIMAGLVFLTMVCMAVYFFYIRPRTATQGNAATQAAIATQNAQNIQKATLTAQAALWTATVSATPVPSKTNTSIPNTPQASPTPVIALPQNSPAATDTTDPAALAAMQTQLAYQLTSTYFSAQGTPGFGGMPSTGFFDEIGLPAMVILAVALVIVILLARRMRKSPVK
jgi:hypothetical protein